VDVLNDAVGGVLAAGPLSAELVHAASTNTASTAAAVFIDRLCYVRRRRAQSSRSRTAIVSSRSGPTPIAEIGALIIFSSAAT
jgi:hypothetical protein